MLFKAITIAAGLFAFGVSIFLGLQIKGLADQIGTKDSVSFLNLHTTLNDSDIDPSMLKTIKKVSINNASVKVEVVATPETRQQGLMNRSSLGVDSGMLFVFEKSAIYPFWMKNTLIPLDMLWIDADRKVVDIHQSAQPCKKDPCQSIVPKATALYVLEVNAGWVARTGTKVGDSVLFFN